MAAMDQVGFRLGTPAIRILRPITLPTRIRRITAVMPEGHITADSMAVDMGAAMAAAGIDLVWIQFVASNR
jgi:hypothetical protein